MTNNIQKHFTAKGVSLKEDIGEMLRLRGTKHIDTVSEEMKSLWRWYASVLLTSVSRKGWSWNNAENRRRRLLRNMVWVGDEALALQILELRGQGYLEEKAKMDEGKLEKRKMGRKKGKINPDECLKKRIDLYFDYREKIMEIRKAECKDGKEDCFGWNEYIKKKEKELYEAGKEANVVTKPKQKVGYHSLLMPKDGVTVEL